MHTGEVTTPALRWLDPPAGPAVELLDQTRLPAEEVVVTCAGVPALIAAIQRLAIRGAPMLGVAGAFGVALAAARGEDVARAAADLAAARPTAVNLAWGVQRGYRAWQQAAAGPQNRAGRHDRGGRQEPAGRQDRARPQVPGAQRAADAALAQAREIAADDARASAAMAAAGLALVPAQARILTHCNTGALVSAGEGTAFAVILAAHRAGRLARLWVDETRPLLQGARLTAWEAQRAGLPHAVLADGAAGSLMAAGQVDLVIIGADRIAADGSVANKVGSYSLAVLARHHGVPFVVAAPVSTIDPATPGGAAITVEQRPAGEVTSLAGRPVAPAGSPAYNPAFDVTPPELITALVTERGVTRPVNAAALRALAGGRDGAEGPLKAVHMELWGA